MKGARFAPNVQLAQKSFCSHPMELLGDLGQEEAHFVLVKIGGWFVLNVPQAKKNLFSRTKWTS
jgi:hypothetical protein